MKILITTDWYKPVVNGVVTSVLNLSEGLKAKGHEVKILTLSPDRHSYEEGDVIYMGSFGMGYIYPKARVKLPLFYKEVKKLVEWQPDLIHSQCEFSTFFAAKKISEILNIPVIHTYHTIYEDYTHYFSISEKWGRNLTMLLTRKLANQVSTIVAPTEKIKNLLDGYGISCPVEVIPTGIDLAKFGARSGDGAGLEHDRIREEQKELIRKKFGIAPDKEILLYVGRLAKEKNIEELIHFQKHTEKYGTVLLIVGDGPCREELEKCADETGVRDSVFFTGMISPSEIEKYYMAGDLFVSASTSETQGLTYAEALASGLPLLCRKDECLDWLVAEGRNGWQYENEADFEERVREWISMDLNTKEMFRREARRTSRILSSENFVDAVERLYRKEKRMVEECSLIKMIS